MKRLCLGLVLALAAFSSVGCSGDDDDSSASSSLEIIGDYSDNFGGEQIITADTWNDAAVVDYDNAQNVVYTQWPDSDEFNPGKFAKTVYTQPKDGAFYFCMVEFSLDTLAEAKASAATADDSDPDNTGCGGDFSWTKATPK